MKQWKGILFALLLAFTLTSCSDEVVSDDMSAHGARTQNFVAHLNGEQDGTPSKATGTAIFQLKNGVLTYKLIVANLDNVTMAHIHLQAPGSNTGAPVVWLYPSAPPSQLIPGTTNGILAEGTVTTLVGVLAGQTLEDLIDAIQTGRTYVNVHTTAYPGGEIRGQIDHGNGM